MPNEVEMFITERLMEMEEEIYPWDLLYGYPVCYFCRMPITKFEGMDFDSLAEHHIDGNHDNDDPKNKAVAHFGCHTEYHNVSRKSYKPLIKGWKEWSKTKEGKKRVNEILEVMTEKARIVNMTQRVYPKGQADHLREPQKRWWNSLSEEEKKRRIAVWSKKGCNTPHKKNCQCFVCKRKRGEPVPHKENCQCFVCKHKKRESEYVEVEEED